MATPEALAVSVGQFILNIDAASALTHEEVTLHLPTMAPPQAGVLPQAPPEPPAPDPPAPEPPPSGTRPEPPPHPESDASVHRPRHELIKMFLMAVTMMADCLVAVSDGRHGEARASFRSWQRPRLGGN